jgi:phosphatidate cytidylyltransferase
MANEGGEREGGFDDLFEDLDKFFSPEERSEARGRRPAEPGSGEAEAEGGAQGEAGAGTGNEPDDELLPSDWLPEFEGLDLSEEPPAPAEPSAPQMERRAAEAGRPTRPEESGGATGEMSQQDWNRLRRVLGDEVAGPEEEIRLPAGGGGAEDLFQGGPEAEEGQDEEERRELTLDDLKKAPAEYRHLPRPAGEAEEASQDARDAVREDRGAFLGEREPLRDDFADVGERPEVPEPGAPQPWEPAASAPGEWTEPGIGDVEAAADQMAEEFRTGLPEENELLAGLGRRGQRTVKVGEPESLMGPAWEEPGSQVVTTEPAQPMFAGRNMPMALLTAAALVALALISIAIDRALFAIIAGGVVLIGQAEVYAAMHRKGYQPATALGLVVGGLLLAAAYLKGEQAMITFVALGALLSFLWYMAAAPKAREGTMANIGATLLGLVYVPLLAGYLMIILEQPVSGRALTLAILGMTFLYDAAAFVIGSLWGSRALAPTISPKKSWEGLLAATCVTFIVSIAVLPSIDPLNLGRAVGLALVIAVFAPLGDLAESALKRDLGVKDMGSVLPGHGGIMDRIDSALFVLPAAFIYLRLIF